QVCSSSSRYLLHKDIKEEVLTLLESKGSALTVGMPEDNPTLVPLVSRDQYDKVMRYIEQGRKDGARLRFGGGRPAGLDTGYFIEPTVFDEVDPATSIAREEIFGPVSIVHAFEDEAEAIQLANGLE